MKSLPKWKITSAYLSGILMIAFLSWTYINVNNEKVILNQSGVKTKGVIVKTVDRMRGLDIQYEFVVSGKRYFCWHKVYKDMRIDDTLDVTYLPKDPTISRPTFELKGE